MRQVQHILADQDPVCGHFVVTVDWCPVWINLIADLGWVAINCVRVPHPDPDIGARFLHGECRDLCGFGLHVLGRGLGAAPLGVEFHSMVGTDDLVTCDMAFAEWCPAVRTTVVQGCGCSVLQAI